MVFQEFFEKYVFWTQTVFGGLQALIFIVAGTPIYGVTTWYYQNIRFYFACQSGLEYDKNYCLKGYKSEALFPLQVGLAFPSICFFSPLGIWLISGIITKVLFLKYVKSGTDHQKSHFVFHIDVLYFAWLFIRLAFFLSMAVVYLFYFHEWKVISEYNCALPNLENTTCSYSHADEQTLVNKGYSGINVTFFILTLLELIYLCYEKVVESKNEESKSGESKGERSENERSKGQRSKGEGSNCKRSKNGSEGEAFIDKTSKDEESEIEGSNIGAGSTGKAKESKGCERCIKFAEQHLIWLKHEETEKENQNSKKEEEENMLGGTTKNETSFYETDGQPAAPGIKNFKSPQDDEEKQESCAASTEVTVRKPPPIQIEERSTNANPTDDSIVDANPNPVNEPSSNPNASRQAQVIQNPLSQATLHRKRSHEALVGLDSCSQVAALPILPSQSFVPPGKSSQAPVNEDQSRMTQANPDSASKDSVNPNLSYQALVNPNPTVQSQGNSAQSNQAHMNQNQFIQAHSLNTGSSVQSHVGQSPFSHAASNPTPSIPPQIIPDPYSQAPNNPYPSWNATANPNRSSTAPIHSNSSNPNLFQDPVNENPRARYAVPQEPEQTSNDRQGKYKVTAREGTNMIGSKPIMVVNKGQNGCEKAVKENKKYKTKNEVMLFVSEQIAADWRRLGRYLKVDDSIIDQIDMDYRKVVDKAYELLKKWFQKNGDKATIDILKNRLGDMGRNDIANKINGEVSADQVKYSPQSKINSSNDGRPSKYVIKMTGGYSAIGNSAQMVVHEGPNDIAERNARNGATRTDFSPPQNDCRSDSGWSDYDVEISGGHGVVGENAKITVYKNNVKPKSNSFQNNGQTTRNDTQPHNQSATRYGNNNSCLGGSVPSERIPRAALLKVEDMIKDDWMRLGIQLGFSQDALNEIDRVNTTVYDKSYEMLRVWINNGYRTPNEHHATLEKLIVAVAEIGRGDIALELQKFL